MVRHRYVIFKTIPTRIAANTGTNGRGLDTAACGFGLRSRRTRLDWGRREECDWRPNVALGAKPPRPCFPQMSALRNRYLKAVRQETTPFPPFAAAKWGTTLRCERLTVYLCPDNAPMPVLRDHDEVWGAHAAAA